MAKYRTLSPKFWTEPEMVELTPEQKLFYAYLLTQPESSQCGVSPFCIKVASVYTGYNTDTIKKLLRYFEKELKKIKYNKKTNEIAVKNWGKYNYIPDNPKVRIHIENEFKNVKDVELIKYVVENSGTDIKVPVEEKKDGNGELRETAKRVFIYWQEKLNHDKAKMSPDRIDKIRVRLKEGYTEQDCKDAIDGCFKSDHHMGRDKRSNPQGVIYDSIELIFRNVGNIERFMGYNKRLKIVGTIDEKVKSDNYDYEKAMVDM